MAVRDHRRNDDFAGVAAAQYHGEIELILIDPHRRFVADIETHVTGATILQFGAVLDDAARGGRSHLRDRA